MAARTPRTPASASDPTPEAAPGAAAAKADRALTYEEARSALAEVVTRLEAGGTTLEDSLALWERGERLADVCQQWLDGARARLDAARSGSAGADGGH